MIKDSHLDSFVSSSVTKGVIDYLLSCDVDMTDIKSATGLDTDAFTAPDVRVSIHHELKLWEYAVQKTSDPFLGLSMARHFDAGNVGLIVYLAIQQPTLMEMINTYGKYHRLVHDLAVIRTEQSDEADLLIHGFQNPGEGPGKPASEITLGAFWKILQMSSIVKIHLKAVHFQFSQPDNLEPYYQFFGKQIKIKFLQPFNQLVFPSGTLNNELLKPDPLLGEVLKKYADDALSKISGKSAWIDQLNRVVAELLNSNTLSIEAVASRLGMSPRTLQRRLKKEGIEFRNMVDKIKRQLAIHYLKDVKLNISEITYLCGFSELAAFSRAFKRWMGVSPQSYRATFNG